MKWDFSFGNSTNRKDKKPFVWIIPFTCWLFNGFFSEKWNFPLDSSISEKLISQVKKCLLAGFFSPLLRRFWERVIKKES